MPRIIDNEYEAKRMTFTEYMDKFQESSNINTNDDVTASESETSPVLYSLRNKKRMSQSSQILFLSQVDPTLGDSSPSPPIQLQTVDKRKAVVPTAEDEIKPSQQLSLSSVVVSQETDDPYLAPEVSKRPLISSPHKYTPDNSEEGKMYTEAIQRLQLIPHTVESINRQFKARELFMILSKHFDNLSPSSSKKRYVSLLLSLLKKNIIDVKDRESNSSPISLQWKPLVQFPVSPTIELLLCSEFPTLYHIYITQSDAENRWIPSTIAFESEFPIIASILNPKSKETISTPSKSVPSTLLINYWSKYNGRLFDFQPNDTIAVHIPSFIANETMIHTLYRSSDMHGILLSKEMMTPQLSTHREWVELRIEKRDPFAVIQNYIFYTLHVHISNESVAITLLPPWQLIRSLPFLPIDLMKHYMDNQPTDNPYIETNLFFQKTPVSKTWIPHNGDIVAVQLQDEQRGFPYYDVGRIILIQNNIYLSIQWMNLDRNTMKWDISRTTPSSIIFVWDVFAIICAYPVYLYTNYKG